MQEKFPQKIVGTSKKLVKKKINQMVNLYAF